MNTDKALVKLIISIMLFVMILSACSQPVVTQEVVDVDTEEGEVEAPQEGFVVGFANGWIGNYWRAQLVSNFEQAAAYYMGTGLLKEYYVANSPNDLTLQLNQLNSFIDQGVDAIMPDPVSAPALDSIIARAKEQGILVVVTNDPAANPDSVAVVGDNYTWQKIQVEWLVEQLGGEGKIVMITGVPGNTADILRQQAVEDVLADYPNIEILGSAPGSWDPAQAQQAMATFLSSYDEIDALLIQDVMAEGVIRAYEAAGRELPTMTGDYTCGFIRLWGEEYPELNSIGVPYAPSHAGSALGFTLRLLQGKELKEEYLMPNPMDESLVNAIMIPVPYVITKDGDTSQPWCTEFTECISLERAVELCAPRADTYMLDRLMDQDEIDAFFKD